MTGKPWDAPRRVLYISSYLSPGAYGRLLSAAPYPPSQAAQKYNALITAGFVENGAEVTALSAPPVSPATSKRRVVFLKGERAGGVRFCYLPAIALPGIKQALTWLSAFVSTLMLCKRDTLVLCYGLIVSASAGARAAARLLGRPVSVIVSDLPEELGSGKAMALAAKDLTRYDGYILLTEAMNSRVNPQGKPYLVMEGMADRGLADRENRLDDKAPGRVCLYAGMLHARYGILRLVEAFQMVKNPQARLVLYGAGDAREAIQEAAKADGRIQYRGVKDNAAVVEAEFAASLLINPRPSDEAFTKYSFPSKNLEYMASGTPVLTTPLPGMPQAYLPYVYLFEGETPGEMAKTLEALLALPPQTLHEKGLAARAFVLENRSNLAQAARLLAFLEGLCR